MADRIQVRVVSQGGVIPHYASLDAAGCDLSAALEAPMVLKKGSRGMIPTGLFFEIPKGYEAQVRPRSGLAAKFGVTVLNSPGTIDADYRGEVRVILINLSDEDFTIEPGMRIAQAVFAPVCQAEFVEVEDLSDTQRGAGGFGSTGHTSVVK